MAEEVESLDDILKNVNSSYLNRGENTQYGYGNALNYNPKALEYVQGLIKAKDGAKISTKKIDGKTKFIVKGPNGEDFTYQQLDDYLSKFEVANSQFNAINEFASNQRKIGQTEKNTSYNKDTGRAEAERIVNSDPNSLMSLALDKSFGNTSFYEDFIASDELGAITYKDLGLTPPKNDKDGKINASDNITDAMKQQIVSTMIMENKNVDLLKGKLIDYFSGHFERNYNAGAPRAQYTPYTIRTKQRTKQKTKSKVG